MRVVIQRVTSASVSINETIKSKIGQGLLILAGFENDDTLEDIQWIRKKVLNLRIFNDPNDTMNLSIQDMDGEILLISQFTLHASTKKGNRPSYIRAAKPDIAIPLYNSFIVELETNFSKNIQTGEFGADMKVSLVNDGPVTISIDSKNRE